MCDLFNGRCLNCGDGAVSKGEQCDGSVPSGKTCKGMGYLGGNLSCMLDCSLDTSGCNNTGCTAADRAKHKYTLKAPSGTSSKDFSSQNMAVDAKGATHLIFRKGLRYVTNLTGAYVSKKLLPGATVECSAITVDSAGGVHIAYSTKAGDLFHRTNVTGSWVKSKVDTNVKCDISMVAGAGNYLAMTYGATGFPSPLMYARLAKGKWTKEQVATSNLGLWKHQLARTGSNAPAVAGDNGDMLLFSRATGAWKPVALGASTSSGYMSMAQDAAGTLHLIYRDSGLKYATVAAGKVTTTLIAPDVGIPNRMTLDDKGKVYLLITPLSGQPASAGKPQCTFGAGSKTTATERVHRVITNASGTWATFAPGLTSFSLSCSFNDTTCWGSHDEGEYVSFLKMVIQGTRLHLSYVLSNSESIIYSGPPGCTKWIKNTSSAIYNHAVICI